MDENDNKKKEDNKEIIIPTPRPRQLKSVTSPDKSSNIYENYEVPRSSQIDEEKLSPPIPAPRSRVSQNKDNVDHRIENNNLNNLSDISSPQKSTGAIRKVPNVTIKNNLMEKNHEIKSERDFDVVSQSSSNSITSSNDSKYQNPNPSDIIKTIGTSSKMLRDSIGERITEKKNSAKHKILKEIKNTKSAVESWASDSKFSLKNVRNKMDNFSMKRSKKKSSNISKSEVNMNESLREDGEFLDTFSFKSPMNAKDETDYTTYEVPRKTKSLSDHDLPSYDDIMKESNSKLRLFKNNGSFNIVEDENSKMTNSNDSMSVNASESTFLEFPEQIYGKIKKIQPFDTTNSLDNSLPITDKTLEKLDIFQDIISHSEKSDNERESHTKSMNIGIDRCDSWKFSSEPHTVASSDSEEPIYANEEKSIKTLSEELLLESQNSDNLSMNYENSNNNQNSKRFANSLTSEILKEFDPLSRDSFDQFLMTNMNHLSLLDTLLSEETYGISDNLKKELEENEQVNEHLSKLKDDRQITEIAEKYENFTPSPKPPKRKKKIEINERQPSVIIHQNLNLKDSTENLLYPNLENKTTNWFVDENTKTSNFVANDLDKPKNTETASINNLYPILPTYEDSKKDQIVSSSSTTAPESTSKSRSFFNFGLNFKSKENKVEVVNYIPRAPFTDDYPTKVDKSILFKLPSGVIEDMLKELSPRFVELNKRHFRAYLDIDMKNLKEHLDLTHLTSIQFLVNHKFAEFKTEAGRQIFCFELNLSIPKQNHSDSPAKYSPSKQQKLTLVYGIHNKNEKCVWMQKIIRSVTNVFPTEYTTDYIRAGWCYMKKSISQQWFSTWIMISRRKLIFHDYNESSLQVLDLRKARYIGFKNSDDSINQLYVEKGSIIFIDCPPHTCYFIMPNTRETKIWKAIITDEAHTNGSRLHEHQLTKDNVPVLIDKCINFIYTNGTMSEGIYRKGGSSTNIQKLTDLLKKNAFNVEITRSEYNEHDVSSVLKRFLRDLPHPLMGKYAVSFLSVTEMNDFDLKVQAYRELLKRLPTVEYQTLKKLLGHLHFIQTQSEVNKMKVENLAMVFGPTLMQPNSNENEYVMDSRDQQVVAELISSFKKLYHLTDDEIKKEQIMLSVLKKYHSAAENLSDTVKKSGDFKIWITLDNNLSDSNGNQDEKKQVNMIVTPNKTAHEICKEMETQMGLCAHEMTLHEVILNGELTRPIHFSEKVLNIVLRWANWPEEDRKSNYLELRKNNKFHEQVERSMKNLTSFCPSMELKFADRKVKSLKSYTLELNDMSLNVLKAEKNNNIKVKEVDISNCVVYLGSEKKRDINSRWSLTFIELNFSKRTRDSPFIGYIIAGSNLSDQVTWYTSILYSIYGCNIFPNPEMVIA